MKIACQVILGEDLGAVLERNAIQQGLKNCPLMSQFTGGQRSELLKWVVVKEQRVQKGSLQIKSKYVQINLKLN